ncbi:MAG TPA: hypothetical protein VG326_11865 [Tepidisphaeraceae bacterium]|jgi:hypothetical protein|nr:hypothetical protein [Tepidisphaeraceae bacterium]
MPDPINYWNPKGRSDPRPALPAAPAGPMKAVPVEFDAPLTRTTELAAAQAIMRAFEKAQIPFHEGDDGKIADREIVLYVRSADQTRAATIAAEIFARRKKIKSFPRPKPSPPTTTIQGPDFSSFLL